MSNKIYNKNSQKQFIPNKKQKPKTKKLDKILFWVLIVLFSFWTIGSTLALVFTVKSCDTAYAAAEDGYNPPTYTPPVLFNVFDYNSTNLVDIPDTVVKGNSAWYAVTLSTLNLPNGDYSFSFDYNVVSSDSTLLIALITSDGVFRKEYYRNVNSSTGRGSFVFTVDNWGDFRVRAYSNASANIVYSEISFSKFMINKGDIAYPYQPYLPTLFTQQYSYGLYEGYELGYQHGYNQGVLDGNEQGNKGGYEQGNKEGYEQGYNDALLFSTRGVFANLTLSGVATYDSTGQVGSETKVNFSDFIPTFVEFGIDLSSLYDYLTTTLVPTGYIGDDLATVDLTLNFGQPFIYNTDNYFIFSGRSVTDILNSTLNLVGGYKVVSDNYYPDNTDGGSQWVTHFENSSNKFLFGFYPVLSMTTRFGRPMDTLDGTTIVMRDGGYFVGYNLGYTEGVKVSFDEGYDAAYDDYFISRYKSGYSAGYNDGLESGTNYSFLGLFSAIIDAPIRAVSGLLNFDLLGFNMLNFFFALCTLAIIISVIRLIL